MVFLCHKTKEQRESFKTVEKIQAWEFLILFSKSWNISMIELCRKHYRRETEIKLSQFLMEKGTINTK